MPKQKLVELWAEIEFERYVEFMKNEDSPRHRRLLKLRAHIEKALEKINCK